MRLISNDIKSADIVRTARSITGLTQAEFGKPCGIPQEVISRYESGKIDITLGRFIELCKAHGINPVEVLNKC